MEDDVQVGSDTIEEVSSPEVVAPSTPEPVKEVAPPVTDAPVVEPPAYTPDYKIKLMGQEKEIPEKFRSLMTDEASSKELREIFEKSFGHEFTKPKYETLKTTFSHLQAEHNSVTGQIGELRDMYSRGDMDGFFQKLNIPEQKILQYALDKINYQELPADQRAVLDGKKLAERQALDYQKQNAGLQEKFQEQVVQARQFALASELARSDVKSMQDSFDQRFGAGSFRNAIIERGQLAWFTSNGKVDLTPSQAIEQVVKAYGLGQTPASATPTSNPPASGAAPKTNTIPNVGSGKSAAPLKHKPRSIEDLKKMAAEM